MMERTIKSGSDSSENSSKGFVGREDEQKNWSEILRLLIGPRRGLLGSIVFGTTPPKQATVETPIKSRLVWIEGASGVGKTRLSLQLRYIAQHDKEFTHRFRTTRLDVNEARERDVRLSALSTVTPLPSDIFLDVLQNHLEREDFATALDGYFSAIEETAVLSRSVKGIELDAVWEYRARALGRSLKTISFERPLLFFIDNCQTFLFSQHLLWRPLFEESGSAVAWILTGAEKYLNDELLLSFAPERLHKIDLEAFTPEEMRHFLEVELGRYKEQKEQVIENSVPLFKSPEKVMQLTELSEGLPIAARLLTYMLESGMTLQELNTIHIGSNRIQLLMNKMLEEIFTSAHPDTLKIYALGLLRRPEIGLLGALLDLQQDMLPIKDLLRRINARYEFLFEPNRQMKLHFATELALRSWLISNVRHKENSLIRLNRRAINYLEERLREWGSTFSDLNHKISDVKWAEWTLDKIWHNFWLSEEDGWAEAMPAFIAALAYKPIVARQLVVMLEEMYDLGVISQDSNSKLKLCQSLTTPIERPNPEVVAQLQKWCISENWFKQNLANDSEFERILAEML